MHMIRHPADGERLHVILPRDAAEIRPEPFADGGGEQRPALLGGEHAMHQAGVEGVHGRFKMAKSPKIAQPFMAGSWRGMGTSPAGTTEVCLPVLPFLTGLG